MKLTIVRIAGVSRQDLIRRDQARMDFGRVACMEEISFRQKSRCLWLQERDRNTKFFHQMANAHKRGNQIGQIKIDGVQLSTPEEVSGGIVDHFRRSYQHNRGEWKPRLDNLDFDTISERRIGLVWKLHFQMKRWLKRWVLWQGIRRPGRMVFR